MRKLTGPADSIPDIAVKSARRRVSTAPKRRGSSASAAVAQAPAPASALAQMEQHAGDAERLLRALANRHRLMVLCALADGELSVGALNERVALSQSALSQHLAVLRNDGLVKTRRASQTIYYAVTEGPALDIVRVLHDAYCCTSPTIENYRTPRTVARRIPSPGEAS